MATEVTSIKSSSSFTEDEQQAAKNALNSFKAGQYDATLSILKKLQKNHPNDARLMHNKVLTEFCKSGKTKIHEFKKNLIKVQKQLYQFIKDDEEGITHAEKNYNTTLSYNQAILLFNFHQYSDTEAMLEKLYENSDSSDDPLFLKICLLLIDTYLITHKAEKANSLISVIEKNLSNQKDKDNTEEKGQSSHSANIDSLQLHLHFLKAICSIHLKSIKTYKKEIKSLSNYSNPVPGSSQTGIFAVASVFLKSNFEYMKCNYHKAYRILGSFPLSSANHIAANGSCDGLTSMFYNNLALIHFHMGKYSIGSFYMQKALYENDVAVQAATKQHLSTLVPTKHHQQQGLFGKPLSVLNMNRKFELLYNCGLQFLYAGNPSQAFDCLSAIVSVYRNNPRLWLRLAECCIQKCTSNVSETNGKSKKSFYHQNLSQYSVVGSGSHQKTVVITSQSNGGKVNNMVVPLPTLEFASVCLNNALTILNLAMNATNEATSTDSQVKPNRASLYGMFVCYYCFKTGLKKAPLFLNQKTRENRENKATEKTRTIVPCLPGVPVSGSLLEHLYGSVLVNSSFVALCLSNHMLALEHACALLARPAISGCHRYLANMYAAEALVSLDRISEAISYLSTDKITSISPDIEGNGKKSPASDDGSSKTSNSNHAHHRVHCRSSTATQWSFPTSVQCAHAYMQINLANAHSLRSEHEKALVLLKKATSLVDSKQIPPLTVLLAVYSQLLQGGEGISKALQLLKYNSPILPPRRDRAPNWSEKPGDANGIPPVSGSTTNSSGTAGDSSSSASSTSRSKSGTPQPSAGVTGMERVVKSKSNDKKRNRR